MMSYDSYVKTGVSDEMIMPILNNIELAVYVWVNLGIVILFVFTENVYCHLAEKKQLYSREEKVERKVAEGSERRQR